MERVTFHRKEVEAWLSGLVCMKIDGDSNHPVLREYPAAGYPTIVIVEPGGRVVYRDSGAPAPDAFVDFFAQDSFNAAVRAFNAQKWRAAAPHFFTLRKWYGRTKLGKEADSLYEHASKQAGFQPAYAAAAAAYAGRLEAARAKLRAAAERQTRARERKREADVLYEKYLRTKAYAIYREIIRDYPDLPVADECRALLRANKKKWKEPKR